MAVLIMSQLSWGVLTMECSATYAIELSIPKPPPRVTLKTWEWLGDKATVTSRLIRCYGNIIAIGLIATHPYIPAAT